MSQYIENDDSIIFHPGYYIEEVVSESGLTNEEFADKLEIFSVELGLLIAGEVSLSEDVAVKLAEETGTSVGYWMNLQKGYNM